MRMKLIFPLEGATRGSSIPRYGRTLRLTHHDAGRPAGRVEILTGHHPGVGESCASDVHFNITMLLLSAPTLKIREYNSGGPSDIRCHQPSHCLREPSRIATEENKRDDEANNGDGTLIPFRVVLFFNCGLSPPFPPSRRAWQPTAGLSNYRKPLTSSLPTALETE